HGIEDLHERMAKRCQRVFDARRHLGIDAARHEAVLLELAQRLREHLLRDTADAAAQLVEAGRPLDEDREHEDRPLVADLREHLARRAAGAHHVEPGHGILLEPNALLTSYFTKYTGSNK